MSKKNEPKIVRKDTVRFQVKPDKDGLSMRNSSHLAAVLGQKGLKAPAFFEVFNEKILPRETFKANQSINIVLEVLTDEKNKKSLFIKSASVTENAGQLIKKAAVNGVITVEKLKEIAKEKIHDMNCYDGDIIAATKTLIGTAMAANVKVEGQI